MVAHNSKSEHCSLESFSYLKLKILTWQDVKRRLCNTSCLSLLKREICGYKQRALCCVDSADVLLVILSADMFVYNANFLFLSYCWSLIFATPCWLSQWLVVEIADTASALTWLVVGGDLSSASGTFVSLFSCDLGLGDIYRIVMMLRSCWLGAHVFLVFIWIARGPPCPQWTWHSSKEHSWQRAPLSTCEGIRYQQSALLSALFSSVDETNCGSKTDIHRGPCLVTAADTNMQMHVEHPVEHVSVEWGKRRKGQNQELRETGADMTTLASAGCDLCIHCVPLGTPRPY